MRKTIIIVAVDKNNLIGDGNAIPWYVKEDLKLFKEKTMGSPIIMGRNTWDSIKEKTKKLYFPGRLNFVISSNAEKLNQEVFYDKNMFYGPVFDINLDDSLTRAKKYANDKDIFIIGGERVYQEALDKNIVDEIYLSRIKGDYIGDKYFPTLSYNWKQELVQCFEEFDFYRFKKEV